MTPETTNGVLLAVEADAVFTLSTSEKTTSLASAEVDTNRVRLRLEGSRRFVLEGGGTLTPSIEIGLRHDGGDAETGAGVNLGGGVAWADPTSGLTADFQARGLVVHEASGFREWGFFGDFGYDSNPASERGLSLSLTSDYGAEASGGADALFNRATLDRLAANDNVAPGGRLQGRIGYGLPVFGERFTGTPWMGFGLTKSGRNWRLGWRLTPAGRNAPDLDLGIEATRSEGTNDSEHSLMLRLAANF